MAVSGTIREPTRVYALAGELSVDPKRILSLCEQLAFAARNQLSVLDSKQRLTIEAIIRRDNPGDDTSGAFVPVWRPPPTLKAAVRLKPDSEKPDQTSMR